MLHFTLRAVPNTLLFHTWAEAAVLWDRVHALAPGAAAVCLMPDHAHILHIRDVGRELQLVMRSYACRRNTARGERVPVFRPLGAPTEAIGRTKERRDLRYIHLNPCRAELAECPLAWPFSTHRDALGLAVTPRVPRVADGEGLHRYVSSDPHAAVDGTPLPEVHPGYSVDGSALPALAGAVSELCRVPLSAIRRRGPARALFVRSARALTSATSEEIAALCGLNAAHVRTVAPGVDREVRLVDRVWRDPRFPGLIDGDLRSLPAWRRYRR